MWSNVQPFQYPASYGNQQVTQPLWTSEDFKRFVYNYLQASENTQVEVLQPALDVADNLPSISASIQNLNQALQQYVTNSIKPNRDLMDLILFFGAEKDVNLVRLWAKLHEETWPYVVFLIKDIFGRNVIQIAINCNQRAVVDFLLDEWRYLPVSKALQP
jgi:hypothetical protein